MPEGILPKPPIDEAVAAALADTDEITLPRCLVCGILTLNKHFCSNSCMAIHDERERMRRHDLRVAHRTDETKLSMCRFELHRFRTALLFLDSCGCQKFAGVSVREMLESVTETLEKVGE